MIDKILFSDKRRTLVIKISQGIVTVYAPKRLDNASGKSLIGDFVKGKAGWIERKIKEYRQNIALLPGLTELETIYWQGIEIRPVYATRQKRIDFDGTALTVPKEMPEEEIRAQLKKVLKRQAKRELSARLSALSEYYGWEYKQFALTDAAGKWGLCNSKKKITLNWRLALLDPALADYVMMHELCHLSHMNHSRAFWQLLSEYMPDWKRRRGELKRYDFLMQYLR